MSASCRGVSRQRGLDRVNVRVADVLHGPILQPFRSALGRRLLSETLELAGAARYVVAVALFDAVMAFSAEHRLCERLDGGVEGECSVEA
jgi:hypothetical protein